MSERVLGDNGGIALLHAGGGSATGLFSGGAEDSGQDAVGVHGAVVYGVFGSFEFGAGLGWGREGFGLGLRLGFGFGFGQVRDGAAGGAGAQGGDVGGGAALAGEGGGEAEVAKDVGEDVFRGASVDLVLELGVFEAVKQLVGEGSGVDAVAGAGGDGVFDAADDADAGGDAAWGAIREGWLGGGRAVEGFDEGDVAADGAGDGFVGVNAAVGVLDGVEVVEASFAAVEHALGEADVALSPCLLVGGGRGLHQAVN